MLTLFSVSHVYEAYAQSISVDAYNYLKSEIEGTIKEAKSASSLDITLHAIYKDREILDEVRMKSEDFRLKQEIIQPFAEMILKEYREKIAQIDERLAKGKKIREDDALEAAFYYSLGYEPICSLDYQKAKTYYQKVTQTDDMKQAIIGCDYKLNKDIKAAEAAMTCIKPSIKAENMADRFGLQKLYQARCNSLSAELMPQIEMEVKRAMRSKDYNALITYIPYKIQLVDSVLSNVSIAISVPTMGKPSNKLEDVWDFSNRNIIYCNRNGQEVVYSLYKHRDYRAYNPTPESISGIIDLAESTSDQNLLQTSLQNVFSDKNNVIEELSPKGLVTLAHLVKMDGDAALLYASVYYSTRSKSWESGDRQTEKTSFEKVMQVLVKKYPSVCSWQGCPISVSPDDGTLTIKSDNYYEVFFKHWAPGIALKK